MGDSGCHRSGCAGRHLLGDAKQSEMGAFPLGWAKRVRNQPRSHVQGCFSSVSFLKPVAVRAGSGLFTSFVAVDPGNCNLQDRFLPNHPRKKILGNEKHPHVAARSTHSPPCASPRAARRGQQHPSCPGRGGPGRLGYGDKDRDRGGRRTGFSLHCCCGGGMFNCSSTAEIICRYECRPRGR